MITSGQMINYDKYIQSMKSMSAPILPNQLPRTKVDLKGLVEYAHGKGVKVGDLTEDEKNRFIDGDTVDGLRKRLQSTIRYKSLEEWNAAKEAVAR